MSSGPTILVIEDDRLMRESVAGALRAAHFTVIEAEDGEVGLALALEKHPDLVILDVAMPKLDGVSVMRQMRADPWGAKALIVLLTSLSDSDFVNKEVLEYKPAYCLKKGSLSLDEVIDRVKVLVL